MGHYEQAVETARRVYSKIVTTTDFTLPALASYLQQTPRMPDLFVESTF
jgi:hypothetical protein